MNKKEAIEALERLYENCEEIDWHLPDNEKNGYEMYDDYMTLWRYLKAFPDDIDKRR